MFKIFVFYFEYLITDFTFHVINICVKNHEYRLKLFGDISWFGR